MAKFTIPVTWVMGGYMVIEAESEQEAVDLAYELPLPDGEYQGDSFSVVTDEIEEEEDE